MNNFVVDEIAGDLLSDVICAVAVERYKYYAVDAGFIYPYSTIIIVIFFFIRFLIISDIIIIVNIRI